MKIIDGSGAVLGRLGVYVAKELMRGEEVSIVNCEEIIITGNKRYIKDKLEERRSRIGSGQKGPKVSRVTERIVKRAIRGMLPNHREGRGKEAFSKLKCYRGVPKELESSEKIKIDTKIKKKFVKVGDIGQ